MPTSVGPNTKGEENLVFGYDLGDVSNSYKGEPTTNLITHVLPNSNWNTNGGGVIITQNYGYDHNGVLRSSKIMDNPSSGNSSFAYTSAFNVSAGTYTFSAMVKTSSANASSNSFMELYNMDPITYLGQTSFAGITPGVWTKVSVTGTIASGTTHIAPHFYSLPGDGTNFIEVVDVQLEQKSHATPYAGPLGTRSATQGLIDLTGNSTIDLSNVSFDSNAIMEFDGSDDYTGVSHANSPITNLTYELVVRIDSIPASNTYRSIWQKSANWNGDTGISMQMIYGNLTFSYGDNWGGTVQYALSNLTAGNWYHIAATVSDTSGADVRFYINGVLVDTGRSAQTPTTTSSLTVGQGNGGTFDGRIDIFKMYSRTLTAQEVRSNFNAVKGRFNI